ncbi:MAG TPA: hypothetical protein VFT04_00595 [Gemmatimonadales bacterium]|nr:hypothetical protein [Gemmatimonadales bacterium]
MSDREWIGSAFVGIGLAGLGLFGALAAAAATLGPIAVPIWAMALAMVVVIVRSPLGKAFADRIADRGAAEELPPELYAELEDLRARMVELEERQDFAERVLSKGDSQPLEEPRS